MPIEFINYNLVETAEQAEERISDFFAQEDSPTITGLALYLGCNDKSQLYVLKKNPEFADLIKKATLHIERSYEERLDSNSKATGAIFALKNFGWVDSPSTQVNVGIQANGLPYQINDAQQQALQNARSNANLIEATSTKVGQEYFE